MRKVLFQYLHLLLKLLIFQFKLLSKSAAHLQLLIKAIYALGSSLIFFLNFKVKLAHLRHNLLGLDSIVFVRSRFGLLGSVLACLLDIIERFSSYKYATNVFVFSSLVFYISKQMHFSLKVFTAYHDLTPATSVS